MPVHVGRNAGCRHVGPYIESGVIQQAGGSRSLLDGLHHRSEKIPVQGGLIHESRYMGFRYDDHVDLGYGSRMMERQDQIVFIDALYEESTRKYILAIPISPRHR